MIHAVLKGKVSSETLHSEDVVTSSVFGALRYVSAEEALAPWLSLARRLDGAHLAAQGPWAMRFWPALTYDDHTVEPDVLLEAKSPDAPHVLIECKLWSGPSGWPSMGAGGSLQGQLGRQWRALHAHLLAEQKHTQQATPRPGCIVYVTADAVMPRATLEAMVKEVEEKHSDKLLVDHLYWLSWRSLVGALGPSNPDDPRVVLDDLRALMARYGFDACREVKPPNAVSVPWSFTSNSGAKHP